MTSSVRRRRRRRTRAAKRAKRATGGGRTSRRPPSSVDDKESEEGEDGDDQDASEAADEQKDSTACKTEAARPFGGCGVSVPGWAAQAQLVLGMGQAARESDGRTHIHAPGTGIGARLGRIRLTRAVRPVLWASTDLAGPAAARTGHPGLRALQGAWPRRKPRSSRRRLPPLRRPRPRRLRPSARAAAAAAPTLTSRTGATRTWRTCSTRSPRATDRWAPRPRRSGGACARRRGTAPRARGRRQSVAALTPS